MWRFALMIACAANPLAAQDWTPLSGAQIEEALAGRALIYDSGAKQDFRASGRTLYNTGQDSWGYWTVRADQYFSMWPPSDLWASYDMARQGNVIRFIGPSGDTTDGQYSE